MFQILSGVRSNINFPTLLRCLEPAMIPLLYSTKLQEISSSQLKYTINETSLASIPLGAPRLNSFSKTPHRGTAINATAVDNTQRFLLSGASDGKIALWELSPRSKNKLVGEIIPSAPENGAASLQYENIPYRTYTNSIHMGRSRQAGASERPSQGTHSRAVNHVQWLPNDNGMFLSSSNDKTLKVWDPNSLGEPAFTFQFHENVPSFDIKEQNVCVAGQTDVRIADLRSMANAQILGRKLSSRGLIRSCIWNPEKEYECISGDDRGNIKVWDTRSSDSLVCSFEHGTKPVNCLKYADTRLVSLSHDDKIRVWDSKFQPVDVQFGNLVHGNRYTKAHFEITPASFTYSCSYAFYVNGGGTELAVLRLWDGKLVARMACPSVTKEPETPLYKKASLLPRKFSTVTLVNGSSNGIGFRVICGGSQGDLVEYR